MHFGRQNAPASHRERQQVAKSGRGWCEHVATSTQRDPFQFDDQTGQEGAIEDRLSDREIEVLELLGKGFSTRQVALQLHLSVKTIEYYREQIKRKLNLKSGAELAQHATRWVQQESPS